MKALPSIAFNDFSGTAGDVTARFEGASMRQFRDQTVCEGNLFEQYDAISDSRSAKVHL